MNIERNREGAWAIYATTDNGQLIQRQYYGYCRREAIRQFNKVIKKLNKGDK